MWSGCTERRPSSPYVARVGSATLGEADLARANGSHAGHRARQYVSTWIATELLFQEAKRRGYAESPDVQEQIEDARRRLVINAFLEQEIYSDDTAAIDEATLQEEFDAQRDVYRLREDIVKMSFVIFDERDAANAFRSRILRGGQWADVLDAIRSDEEAGRHLLRAATSDYFSQSTLYPEELWKIARTLSKEDVSYVVKTNAGFCVALVHDLRKQGDVPDFLFARDEVRQRILLQRRNARYTALLDELRATFEVEVRLPQEDSTALPYHE